MNLDDLKGQLRPEEINLLKVFRALVSDYGDEELNEEIDDWENILVPDYQQNTDIPQAVLDYLKVVQNRRHST